MLSMLLKSLVFSIFLSGTACAEEPKAPVEKTIAGGGGTGGGASAGGGLSDVKSFSLPSLVFEGLDPFGKACNLYLSVAESDGEEQILAKVGYELHGVIPLDMAVDFYRFQIKNNQYLPLDTPQAGTSLALASAILKSDEIIDMNLLADYEQKGELLQSLRLDMLDVDAEAFAQALKSLVADPNQYVNLESDLDQLRRSVLKLEHNNHYDAVACTDFSVSGTEVVSFEIGQSDTDHDHDHDHDHDGHDHGHDHD